MAVGAGAVTVGERGGLDAQAALLLRVAPCAPDALAHPLGS